MTNHVVQLGLGLYIIFSVCLVFINARSCITISPLKNKFDSNHWFHMSEFFLSKNGLFDGWLKINDNYVMLAPSQRFVTHLTPVTMFLLMISFTDGNPSSFEVVHSPAVTDATDIFPSQNISTLGLRYVYRRSNSEEHGISPHVRGGSFNFEVANNLVCSRVHPMGVPGQNHPVFRWFEDKAGFGQQSPTPGPRKTRLARLRSRIRNICGLGATLQPDRIANDFSYELRESPFLSHHSTIRVVSAFAAAASHVGGSASFRVRVVRRRLLLYQRDSNRRFADLEARIGEIAAELQLRASRIVAPLSDQGEGALVGPAVVVEWEVYVLRHDDALLPCDMIAVFQQTDLLLTTHGFQEISLLFLSPGATVVEVFPFRYFKPTYQLLAKALGISSYFLENDAPTSVKNEILRLVPSTEYCMQYLSCRGYARSDNVVLRPSDIGFVVGVMANLSPLGVF